MTLNKDLQAIAQVPVCPGEKFLRATQRTETIHKAMAAVGENQSPGKDGGVTVSKDFLAPGDEGKLRETRKRSILRREDERKPKPASRNEKQEARPGKKAMIEYTPTDRLFPAQSYAPAIYRYTMQSGRRLVVLLMKDDDGEDKTKDIPLSNEDNWASLGDLFFRCSTFLLHELRLDWEAYVSLSAYAYDTRLTF